MTKKEFDAFLASQPGDAKPTDDLDWGKQREEWISLLAQLYGKVESFLRDYVKQGQVKLEYGTKELFEDPIGSYEAPTLTIQFAGRKAVLDPLGTVLIGTKGRVNMNGAAGTAKFILTDKNAVGPKIRITIKVKDAERKPEPEQPFEKSVDWTWKLIRDGAPRPYVDIDQDVFFDALMGVVGG